MGMKVNVCTSGSSGVLTGCIMTTKNVVPNARELACNLRDGILSLLQEASANDVCAGKDQQCRP